MAQDIKEFLTAEPIFVDSFFGKEGLLLVPPYQREYAWSHNEVEELFNDIMESEDNQTYFIGSVILLKMDGIEKLEIIDGQQRSTTISLMYISLYYLSSYINLLAQKVGNTDLKTKLDVLINELSKCLFPDSNILTLSEQKGNKRDYESILSLKIEDINIDITKVIDENIDKRRKLFKNLKFIYSEIRKTILNDFQGSWSEKSNNTYLEKINMKWTEEIEKLVFKYLSEDDFDSLYRKVNLLVKTGTDKDSSEFNQYIGSLENSILTFIKNINLNKDEITSIDKIIKSFNNDTPNSEIAENISAILKKSPEELMTDLNSKYGKAGIKSEIIEKKDEIKDKEKETIEQEILPVVNKFLEDYTESIKRIKSKIDTTALVKMIVKNPSSANNLFETINHRGMPLSAMDLMKNDILRSISQEDLELEQEEKNLDSAIEEWNVLIENIESPDEQIRFLRHFYISSYINDTNFVMPSKSNIVDLYKRKYFESDNKYALFTKMINASKTYLFMTNFEKETTGSYKFKNDEDNNLKEYFLDLSRVNAKPSLSMFLWLLINEKNNENIIEIYKYIKVFFLKRHITNMPEVKYLDGYFKEIILEFISNEDKDKLEIIKSHLESKEPNDTILKERLSGAMYDINSEVTRYILIELHKLLSPATVAETLDLWQKNSKNNYIFTIEHILPQNEDIEDNWTAQKLTVLEWQNILIEKAITNNEFTEEEQKLIIERHIENIHKLGNLTMTAYNSSLSDDIFSKKLNAKDNDNKFIGFKNGVTLNSQLKFNIQDDEKTLATLEKFGITEIENRGEVMVKKIMDDILKKV